MLAIFSTVAAAEVKSANLEKGNARHGGDALGPALIDSLVVAGEDLADLVRLERIWHAAEIDSMRIELRYLRMENDYLRDRQKRWYHDERLWFLAGSLAAYATVSVVTD